MFVLKINIYKSKLFVILNSTSLVIEHSIPDSDFMDRLQEVYMKQIIFLMRLP